MILTMTPNVEGRQITEYMRVIGGETIVGMAMFRDFAGRVQSQEGEVIQARDSALNELWNRAQQMGADAVVSVNVQYDTIGADNGLLMVTATGTAVKLA